MKTIGIVGTGVIGSGWAAQFLASGLDVIATDPKPHAERELRTFIDNVWPILQKTSLSPNASPERLQFASSIDKLADVDFVQENAPENETLKTKLLAQIDAVVPEKTIIASSSSGLLPSRIQSGCRHPERVVVGHPFNPVYLLPLVEVLGGNQTSQSSIDKAEQFYHSLGKKVLHVRTEIPGYIADRLQEALWREALHMVAEGVATTEEIDMSITCGPGIRWALMGPCLTFHMAGGQAGMKHMLEQFGPALKLPWTKLIAPELTDELAQRMISGTKKQANGRSTVELEKFRDEFIIKLLNLLQDFKKL